MHVVGDPEPPNVITVRKKAGHDRFTHDILFIDLPKRWVPTLSTPFASRSYPSSEHPSASEYSW